MAKLYKWSTDEQIDQLKQFLAHNGPTTASLLGYILSTGECESDAPGKSVIWTSHTDPFHTTDIVVWIIDSDHRIRFFVTSEIELNFKEMTPDAAILAHKASYSDQLPAYFTHAEDEALYKRSLQIVEEFLTLYMDQRYGADKGVLYHDTCLLWAPIFHKLFKINIDTPCYVFSRQASKPLDSIKLPTNYTIDSLKASDVETVVTKNKIAYEPRYVQDCFRISSAIRTGNGELVAWGMTHRDLYIGALHVLPEHRRQGLAEILVMDLCRQYVNFFKAQLPTVPLDQLYAGACVEMFNDASAGLFKKTGFKTQGLGTTWIHCCRK
ncbi:unnamed protein product [Mucor circinelloides]|uniref:N-acetyltransferase domain-containing protein n=1 Tax=Mucor circinelloides f. circinelloides (strain 1006PhL) TaxID=1220926 RepID=S2JKA2_MUCC1|nr:hypothetical protein HMPREF1544_02354 [Mucor circinelloides 1006PhL]